MTAADFFQGVERWVNVALFMNGLFWLSLSLTRRAHIIPARTQRVGWGYVFLMLTIAYTTADAVLDESPWSHRVIAFTIAGLVSNVTILYRFRDDL